MAHWTDYLDRNGPDGAYLSWSKVEPRVGISRTTAWRLQKRGDFPRPYVMSPGRVAYRESEVEAWKASRGHRSEPRQLRRPQEPRSASPAAPSETPGTIVPEAAQDAVQPSFDLNVPPPPLPALATPRRGRSSRRSQAGSGGDQITFNF
jgi:predicted DNA-binding transcriptional regulator AlpA